MSDEQGPWGRAASGQPPASPTTAGRRTGLWILLLVAGLAGLVFALARALPGAVHGPDDWASVGYDVALAGLISAGLLRAGRGAWRQHLRHAAIWVVIVAVLALGFAYRDLFIGAGRRLQVAFSPGAPVATGDHELAIPQDAGGAFMILAKVNGQPVRFLVDTGASDTVLSPDDARRLGVNLDALTFDRGSETANGVGHGAAYAAQTFEIGPIHLDNVRMTINQAPMSTSLLGMSALGRLESFEVRGDKLVLRWRDGR